MTNRALIVVDVQKDFCEGGSLAVEGGNAVAEKVAEFVKANHKNYRRVIFTKDWHKENSDNGGHIQENPDYVDSWPSHCIEGTTGADFHPALNSEVTLLGQLTVMKGHGQPSYSAFDTPLANAFTDSLDEFLKDYEIHEVDVVGLAFDYCVFQTAVDAVKNGYKATILKDMTASVHPENDESNTLNLLSVGVNVE